MRNFTPEDFNGAGQYLIRMSSDELYCREQGKRFIGHMDGTHLSTILYKVGYIINNDKIGNGTQLITLTSMSDGFTIYCDYPNFGKTQKYLREGKVVDFDEDEKSYWQNTAEGVSDNWQVFCDYLNNQEYCQEYRFATQAEIVLCVLSQKSRFK